MPANQPTKSEMKTKVKKPKKELKITKSKAAEIKEAIERGQIGATESAPKQKPAAKKLTPKTQQRDMITEGKLMVPEPDSPLYKAGKRLAEAVEQEQLVKDEKGEALQEVIGAMRKAKRYNYKVSGYIFELQHFGAQDKVKVIKPK